MKNILIGLAIGAILTYGGQTLYSVYWWNSLQDEKTDSVSPITIYLTELSDEEKNEIREFFNSSLDEHNHASALEIELQPREEKEAGYDVELSYGDSIQYQITMKSRMNLTREPVDIIESFGATVIERQNQ
ncbi:MAG: hypothetical protein AAF546_12155 [Verrucomicrobiota bacterium]